MKSTKKIVAISLVLFFIEALLSSSFTAFAETKINGSKNPQIILAKIRTSSSLVVENITTQSLVLDMEGFKYQPLNSNEIFIVKNDVKIIAKNITYSNAAIEGNLYISSNNVSLNNIKINGNLIIDPGKSGTVVLNNVTTKNINILSGGEPGIYLNKVISNSLTVNSINKVKLEATYTTNIGTTTINSDTIINSNFGIGGSVIIAGKNKPDISVELNGDFKKVKSSKEAKVVINDIVLSKDKPLVITPRGSDFNMLINKGLEEKGLLKKINEEKLTAQKKLISGINISKNHSSKDAYVEIITINDYNDRLIVVNKNRSLPDYWKPKDLIRVNVPYKGRPEARYMRKEAADALAKLFAKAKKDKVNLYAVSGFRSFELQKTVYAKNVAQNGQARASMESAYPGKSEHQTGLAMDISCPALGYSLKQSFGNTREGKWLKENAAEFGFIIRYPKGKEAITGYIYEPWHIRYVGREVAVEIMKRGLTLEEYFGVIK